MGGERAAVIGGGFAGLASALRLRALGLDVTLPERQPDLGGRARRFQAGPYAVEAGPTVITAPFVLEDLFTPFGEAMADHATLLPVEPYSAGMV